MKWRCKNLKGTKIYISLKINEDIINQVSLFDGVPKISIYALKEGNKEVLENFLLSKGAIIVSKEDDADCKVFIQFSSIMNKVTMAKEGGANIICYSNVSLQIVYLNNKKDYSDSVTSWTEYFQSIPDLIEDTLKSWKKKNN